jgi:hypothetical protein
MKRTAKHAWLGVPNNCIKRPLRVYNVTSRSNVSLLPDVRPVLAKVADLERELVAVGGQAVNFWAPYCERRVPELALGAPFTSKDIGWWHD